MRKILLLLTLTLFATAAMADVFVTVYQNIPNPDDASDPANYASSLANATFNSTGIDFETNDSPGTAVSVWLNNPTFLTENNGFNANGAVNNSELVITGTIGLLSGNNSFVVGHDDGVALEIPGIGSGDCNSHGYTDTVLCDPGPTGFTNTPFNVNNPGAAGNFAFTLYYAECCGGPADLLFEVNDITVGTVPEPASLVLFGSGVLAVATRLRKRKV